MTAIYAYVCDDLAFISADTRRAIWELSSVVTKVHRWSEHILLAQTGSGVPLSELLCEMTVWRDRNPTLIPFSGLAQVISKLAPQRHAAAKAQSPISVNGTIVAACASDGASPAQIVTFDFQTGSPKTVGGSGSVYADGSDPPAFLSIAQSTLTLHKTPTGALQLDRWAMDCLGQAVAVRPDSVGWPADLAIARPFPAPTRLTIVRRVQSVSEPANPAFTG